MITPHDSQRLNRDLAERIHERRIAALKDVYENGIFGFARSKPREMLNGILNGTIGGKEYLQSGVITQDLALLLSDGYIEGRKRREAPLTLAEELTAMYDQMVAENQQMAAVGLPMPEPEKPPSLWPLLFRLPLDVPGWVISDLRRLMRQHEKRQEERPREQSVQRVRLESFAGGVEREPVTVGY